MLTNLRMAAMTHITELKDNNDSIKSIIESVLQKPGDENFNIHYQKGFITSDQLIRIYIDCHHDDELLERYLKALENVFENFLIIGIANEVVPEATNLYKLKQINAYKLWSILTDELVRD